MRQRRRICFHATIFTKQARTAELYKNLEILLNKHGKNGTAIKYKLHKDSNQS